MRCLNYNYAVNGYAPYIGGMICNRRIASDPVSETIQMAQQQGLAVVMNCEEPLTGNNLAVRLFKERGFTWGGDEPNGNPHYFSK